MTKQLMDKAGEVKGAGGGGGKGQTARTPVEAPNTLQAFVRGRILDLIAYGPIKGLVNGLKSVYLDSTPVQNADDTFNFEGVTLEFRNGTPDQDVIPGFRSVENTTEINTEVLFDNPPVRALTNNDADAFAVTVQLAGLAKQEDNGDVVATSVTVLVDISANGGAWQNMLAKEIKGKTTSAYPQTFRVNLPDMEGPFSVRVRRANKESESEKLRDALTWTLLTEIIDQPFSYPNMALAGISVNSKLFGSSMPSRSYDVYLSVVKVPSNYDPETRTYTGLWDGTFKEAWSDNPAWAYYDLATHPVIGAGLQNVDKWELYSIAKYCDELVPDGYGGMEPRFTINTVFSEQEDAYVALATLAGIFRGITYWGTNTVVAVGDMPADPVRIVGPGNVIDGDFNYVGTSNSERHSVCVVMWNDPENEGKPVPEVWEDADAIAEMGWKETRVTAVGCNSRGQALRLAKWILYSERMETQTLTYKAKLDHATVRPGNIIEVADPDFQGVRMAGRVIEPSRTALTLDAIDHDAIATVGGDWYVSVVMPDQRIEKALVSSFVGNTINLVGALSEAPIYGAVWALSSAGLNLPQYRVVSVKEEDNSTYVITATEYDPNKYDFVELGLKLPERPTSLIPAGPITPPTDLTFQVYKYQAGGGEHQGVVVSWKPSTDVRVDSNVLDVQGPTDAAYRTVYNGAGVSFDLKDAQGGQWLFRVRSMAKNVPSQWLMRTVQLQMLLLPTPPDSVNIKIGTLELTLTPVSAYPDALWEFWRSLVPLEASEIEGSASFLATGSFLVDTGLKPDTNYYYFIRGVNQYGKSTWYAAQAKTDNNFDDILDAVREDIENGELYQFINEQIDTRAAEVAIEKANEVVSGALDEVNQSITLINGEIDQLQAQINDAIDALAYNKDQAYTTGEFVRDGNNLWQAKVDVPANEDGTNGPPNGTYWRDAGDVLTEVDGLAARVTSVETSVTNIEGALTAQASEITGIKASLNDKADASALTALTTRVTAAEGAITSQSSSITSLQTSVNNVGGDNLVTNSSFEELLAGSTTRAAWWLVASTVASGFTTSMVDSTLAQSTKAQRLEHSALPVDGYIQVYSPYTDRIKGSEGVSYVLSAWVRGTAGMEMRQFVDCWDAAGTVIATYNVSHTVSAEYDRYLMKITAPAGTVSFRVFPALLFNRGTETGPIWVEVDNVQFQQGEVATAYSPSIELGLAGAASATSALTTRMAAAEGVLTSQASSITSLQASLSDIGGDNLLPNSSFEVGTGNIASGWLSGATVTGGTVAIVDSPLNFSTKAQRVAHAALPTGQSAYIVSPVAAGSRLKIRGGQTYVLSAWVKASTNVILRLLATFYDEAGTATQIVDPTSFAGTGEYTRISATFTAPASAVTVAVTPARMYNLTGATISAWMEIDNAQFQEGTVPTAYAPAIDLGLNANGTAISALTTRVTAVEGTTTSQGSAITSLTNTLSNVAGSGVNQLHSEYSWITADTMPTMSKTAAIVLGKETIAAAASGYGLTAAGFTTAAQFIGFYPVSATPNNMEVTPGTYLVSMYLRGSVAGSARVALLNLSSYSPVIAYTTTRTRYTFIVTIAAGGSCGLALYPNFTGINGVNVTVDSVMVERRVGETNTPSPFVAGPSAPEVTALATAATALTTRVTAAEGTITSQGNAITTLTNTVAGKADTSAVNALTTRVSAAESAITSQATATTALQASMGNIGGNGNNILPDDYSWLSSTTMPAVYTNAATTTAVAVAGSDSGYGYNIAFSTTNAAAYLALVPVVGYGNMRVEPGTYIVSMYIRGSAANQARANLYSSAGSMISVGINYTTTRTRISFAITVTRSDSVALLIYPNNLGSASGSAVVDSVMVERKIGDGNAASPFVPGPSASAVAAQASAISNLDTRVTAAEGVNTAQSSSITSLTTRMGNAETSITTTANSLASTNGTLSSMWAMKIIQATSGGKQYVAGMGVSMVTTGGITQSEILFQADRLALINAASGGITIPFFIEGGVTYIQSALIKAATITSAHIANAAITTAKIGDAQITTAKIANAAITTAKIGNAQVDTLQLAGRSVTIPVSVYTAATVTCTGTVNALKWTVVQQITIAGTGEGAMINVTAMFGLTNSAGYWRLRRSDGTVVADGRIGGDSFNFNTPTNSFALSVYQAVTGTFTYYFEVSPWYSSTTYDTLYVANRAITYLGVMR